MAVPKSVRITDFLNEEQWERAVAIWNELLKNPRPPSFAQRVCDEITAPNIAEINRMIGQENEPKFLAYFIEYIFIQSSRGGAK